MRWAKVARLSFLFLAGTWATFYVAALLSIWYAAHLGWDFAHYLNGARTWLATGSPYAPEVLAGSYVADASTMPFIHPPTALPLFAAFLVLPAFLWWAIPLGVLGAAVWRWRPQGWGWYAVIACAIYPRSLQVPLVGNTDMWVAAGIAGGLWLGWPALVVAIKPTAMLFGVVGFRRRSWWIGLAIVALAAISFGPLWGEWVRVVMNVSGSAGYLIEAFPLYVLPLLAWITRAEP